MGIFSWSSCFLASFVFSGSLRRYLKSPKVVHVVMEHMDVLTRRSRTTCHASQHVMCIEEVPGDRTVDQEKWGGVLTQMHDHDVEEEEEPYKLSSNRLLMCLFLLKLSETDSVGGGISQKTPVLALFSSQMRGGSQTQILTAVGGSGNAVEDVLPPVDKLVQWILDLAVWVWGVSADLEWRSHWCYSLTHPCWDLNQAFLGHRVSLHPLLPLSNTDRPETSIPVWEKIPHEITCCLITQEMSRNVIKKQFWLWYVWFKCPSVNVSTSLSL